MYFNGRNDVIEPDDVIGVESISVSTNPADGRRFVTLDLEIPADMELAPVEKLMVCMPDGATPRLFIPKSVVPISAVSEDAPAVAEASAQEVEQIGGVAAASDAAPGPDAQPSAASDAAMPLNGGQSS